jgi:hypothetical protein
MVQNLKPAVYDPYLRHVDPLLWREDFSK